MKRILTIFCAIAFSGAAFSAQNNADTIRVSRNGSDDLFIIVKEKQSIDRQARKEHRLAEKAQEPAYMVNVGYDRGYRADIELSWANKSVWGITSSHGFSLGYGLYVGGGAGFGAELTKQASTPESNWNASYFVPVFADIKYSFLKTLVGFWGRLDGKHMHNVKLGVAYTF